MTYEGEFEVRLVDAWDLDAIADLYRAGGWWKEEWNPAGLSSLIRGSFAFAVAVESSTGRTVGMGRVISDGVSDGYVQDLVVHPNYRDRDIGTMILSALLKECTSAGVTWIALIAEPETEAFYARSGFQRMEGHTPMRWYPEKR
ncbi:GNAT family N-acetyltransferase [Methanoculleus receptaculi]|jgi:ribosomal protein S18 acetylase RimI-like enzyme|uniref:GNAT family N-acetyltransferase n=1 Tax=Methanoculleus receptaculi TaxID=394967 RepID=A0AAX4FWI5_9EURY|nr:GNAT family N-acetyltransferase [Methanoculleus receptaculi]WOX58250.1 GNAT family N-acetyltransferase [Methanoculleus receptaculi]